jgi:hypothetical protein
LSVTLTVIPLAKLVPVREKARAVVDCTMPAGEMDVMVAVAVFGELPPPPALQPNKISENMTVLIN